MSRLIELIRPTWIPDHVGDYIPFVDERYDGKCQELVRCKDCCHWKPPHILLNDGKQRAYKPDDGKDNPLGFGVSNDVGINVGGRCWVDHNCGYGRDMRVCRSKDDFCSRASKLPDGITGEEYWGLSEEPSELRDDFDY